MQPACPNLANYLPHVPYVNTLLPEVMAFPDNPQITRFSMHKEGLRKDRLWTTHFSGYCLKKLNRIEILFFNSFKKPLITTYKKIKHGFLVVIENDQVKSINNVLVKIIKLKSQEKVDSFFETFRQHKALYEENKEGLARPPSLLEKRTNQTDATRFKVLYFEFRYTATLNYVETNSSVKRREVIKGLREVASALKRLHTKKWVHLDVKIDNILIQDKYFPQMYLFDFDFMAKVKNFSVIKKFHVDYEKMELVNPEEHPYFAWDMVYNQNSFVTPFCDLYGWTITLGILMWGDWFKNYAELRIPLWNGAFENILPSLTSRQEIALNDSTEESPNSQFHHQAFLFVKKIIQIDLQRGRLFQSKERADQLGTPEGDKLLSPYELGMDEAIALCDSLLKISNVTC